MPICGCDHHIISLRVKNALGSIKDVPPDLHKSGIYRIQCETCGKYYFGMTVRKLFVRYNEHEKSAKWKQKTAVGKHISSTNHTVNIDSLKLVQEVRRPWNLELYEAIHIKKNLHMSLLNADEGNVKSPLLKLFATKRTIDEHIIEICDNDIDESSHDDIFFDCE